MPSAPIDRRHRPVTDALHDRAYEEFRPCLRWEFSFSCPFCLLHEAQLCPAGAVASSQYWIEHLLPRSERPDLCNVYSNLVYACRRCNIARRYRPRIDAQGRRLLDPCVDVWTRAFSYEADELHALTPDAAYTSEAYDVNAPSKVALRRDRREAVDESLHVLATVPALLDRVMAGIDLLSSRELRIRLEVAEQLHKALAAARRTLIQLSAVPHDADPECACDANACELPEIVATTLLQVELGAGRQ